MKKRTANFAVKSFFVLLILALSPFGLAAAEGESFTVEVKTKGKGRVILTPEGGEYPAGTEVTITAVAEKGFTFANWDEDLEGFELTKTVVIEEDLLIQALFKRAYKKGVVQNTDYGKVKGQREVFNDPYNSNIDFDVLAWRGLPYAAPPVGELRWKAPRELQSWKGVRDARSNSQVSVQLDMTEYKPMGAEDCLYLNVFRPNTTEEGLPVYFWIHGGANTMGSVGEYEHIRNFAQRTNSVVVVIQYRVGDMGLFYSDELEGDESDRSGNFITLDQIKALKWVRDNIEYFGGNPGNVTIGGESAGAHNVLTLLVTPLAKGLFHKAVYQSSGLNYVDRAAAIARAKNLAQIVRKKRAEAGHDLSEMSDMELLKEVDAIELLINRDPNSYYGHHIDGYVIPEDPMKMLAEGNYTKVPIIMGACKDEMTIFSAFFMAPSIPIFNQIFGTNIPLYDDICKMIALDIDVTKGFKDDKVEYRAIKAEDIESLVKASSILSRLWQSKHVHKVAKLMQKHQDDVYLFQYNWDGDDGSQYQKIIGATHAAEIPFFQGGSSVDIWLFGNVYTEANREGREELERVTVDYIGNLLAKGNPNGEGLPLWEPVNRGDALLKMMILDSADSSNTADPAYSMVEREHNHQALIAEGAALEGRDQAAFDMFKVYLMNLRLD